MVTKTKAKPAAYVPPARTDAMIRRSAHLHRVGFDAAEAWAFGHADEAREMLAAIPDPWGRALAVLVAWHTLKTDIGIKKARQFADQIVVLATQEQET